MTKNALDALVGHVVVDWLLARPRPIFKPVKALISKAPSPVAGDARLNTTLPWRSSVYCSPRLQATPSALTLRGFAKCSASRLKHAYRRFSAGSKRV